MKPDRMELITLRISVARIAQAAGICPVSFGALTIEPDDGYGALHSKAIAHDRGWNRLALELADRVRSACAEFATKPAARDSLRMNGGSPAEDEHRES